MMMMSIYSSDALEMYPPLRDYDIATNFASFYCINDDADDIEFLYPNFTIIISSYRICGNAHYPRTHTFLTLMRMCQKECCCIAHNN